ncbi:MAG TPA: NADH-quinone oxidoreductase subunit NuoG [Actinomycetota bacterium]|nr:NADH-quinone oxidoreductase subunit NuoG [Actinomycetota bacterium]
MSSTPDVTLTIDGKEVTVPTGTLIIRAAERLGIEVPRFCDHPLLRPAGACRQCYVRVEGQPKLATSCTMTVAPGMMVRTQNSDPEVADAQRANIEFLLLNHPLDCPICDRGGECPLQDQALAYGPGDTRFREAKRVFPKPIPMSPLVGLDRERCILCARCTRFCDEISGDRFLELFARGAGERVAIAAGEDFRSPFSGNTVQICPVGALTSTPYRFAARPFDLTYGDSVCPHCSAGCNMRVDVRRGEVVRHLARDEYDVNDSWLCDKGRYAYRFPDSPERITTPLIRDHGLEPASFGEVMTKIAGWVDGARVGVLTGGRLMDEDYYALSKLTRTVFRTNDLDHRRGSGAPEAELVAARTPMGVTYRDVERAPVILVVGLDAEQEVPILHLRLRKAAAAGARIWVVHPRRTRLQDVATHILIRPGDEARVFAGGTDPVMDEALEALRAAGDTPVVLAGERSGAADAAQTHLLGSGARFAYVTRRAGDRGALRAGVHPSLLPGGRSLGEAGAVESRWKTAIGREAGRDSMGILEACANREIDVLYLVGVDPLRDFPDGALARRALENVPVKIVQSLELGSLEPFADAFLPAAPFLEKEGHVTNWEGRGQRFRRVRDPEGMSLPDWEIFASLGLACGGDLGFETLDELHDEMGELLAPLEAAGPSIERTTTANHGTDGTDGLTLFTYPLLVDEGRLSERADELKAALAAPPFVEIHPDDAGDVADGADVVLKTATGEVTLRARVTEHVAQGSVFVPFNQAGCQANQLLDGDFVTSITVEPVAELVDAETGAEA